MTLAEVQMRSARPTKQDLPINFWSVYYRILFWIRGIAVGRGFRVLGPILVRISGTNARFQIGANVTLLPGVDIKMRGNARMILHDGVYIESNVRLLAVNEACLELGDHAQVGIGSVINAGVDVLIGRYCAIGGYCSLISSEHGYQNLELPIKFQDYSHAPIHIHEDVWLATHVLVRPGVQIGKGSVVGAYSVVHESVSENTVCVGNPARVIKRRDENEND